MQHGLAERGLSLARAGLIWELQEHGARTQRDLSRALRVTPRNITGLVDSLEADGLAERSSHPSDRRATLVVLTEKGRNLAAIMRREQDDFAQLLFADASADDLATFVAMLDHVLARVRTVMRGRRLEAGDLDG